MAGPFLRPITRPLPRLFPVATCGETSRKLKVVVCFSLRVKPLVLEGPRAVIRGGLWRGMRVVALMMAAEEGR